MTYEQALDQFPGLCNLKDYEIVKLLGQTTDEDKDFADACRAVLAIDKDKE